MVQQKFIFEPQYPLTELKMNFYRSIKSFSWYKNEIPGNQKQLNGGCRSCPKLGGGKESEILTQKASLVLIRSRISKEPRPSAKIIEESFAAKTYKNQVIEREEKKVTRRKRGERETRTERRKDWEEEREEQRHKGETLKAKTRSQNRI
jgi:hypothetical protein